MVKPYSIDLRQRVLAAFDEGMPVQEIGARFKITTRVLLNWRRLRESTGSFAPKTNYHKGPPKKNKSA
jgi:transposase